MQITYYDVLVPAENEEDETYRADIGYDVREDIIMIFPYERGKGGKVISEERWEKIKEFLDEGDEYR